MVAERFFHQRPSRRAGIGGVHNGHIAVAGQPGAGLLHIAACNQFAGLATEAVVRIVEIRLCGFRAHQGPAHVAIVKNLRPNALGLQTLTDTPRQRGLAARGQAHHRYIQLLHMPLRWNHGRGKARKTEDALVSVCTLSGSAFQRSLAFWRGCLAAGAGLAGGVALP